eukprot:495728-Pyramimonas_sp.AAC.1
MGSSFNDVRGVYLAKGDEPGDGAGPVRTSSATRPLGLKNADCKVVTAVCTRSLSRALPDTVDPMQRGFVPTRNLGYNVFELD